MGIMLITKVGNALTKDMTNRYRFGITKKLQLLVQFIAKLKGNSFHLQTTDPKRALNTIKPYLRPF